RRGAVVRQAAARSFAGGARQGSRLPLFLPAWFLRRQDAALGRQQPVAPERVDAARPAGLAGPAEAGLQARGRGGWRGEDGPDRRRDDVARVDETGGL